MIREKLASGQPVFGFSSFFADPGIIEAIGANFEYCRIDGQHGNWVDVRLMADAVRACDLVGISSFVRVPDHAPGRIGQVVDLCAHGVVAPYVNTAEQARDIVRAMCFPPLGNRSFGGRRVIDRLSRTYSRDPALRPVVIVQIETPEALGNAEAIAAVEGVDVLFLGPDDMKTCMGLPMHLPLEAPELAEAARGVVAACRNAGKHALVPVGPSPESLRYALETGFSLIDVGADVGFLKKACGQAIDLLKQVQAERHGQGS